MASWFNVKIALSVLFHASIIVIFFLVNSGNDYSVSWANQIYLLLLASMFISLFLSSRFPIFRVFFFSLKAALFIILSNIIIVLYYGSHYFLLLQFSLFALLCVEISSYLRFIPSLGLSLAVLLLQVVFVVFNKTMSGKSPEFHARDFAVFLLYSIGLSLLINMFVLMNKRLGDLRLVNRKHSETIAQLIDANIGFQSFAVSAGEESAVRERKQISRDIHDTTVHVLMNIIMLAESVKILVGEGAARTVDVVNQIIGQANSGVDETRLALRELRQIENGSKKGLHSLYQLVQVFSKVTGIRVDINYGNVPSHLEGDIHECAYRIIQESLSNAFRHGDATSVRVSLWIDKRDDTSILLISVIDDGKGAGSIQKGIGFLGMSERVEMFGGTFEAGNHASGFKVSASIPLKE